MSNSKCIHKITHFTDKYVFFLSNINIPSLLQLILSPLPWFYSVLNPPVACFLLSPKHWWLLSLDSLVTSRRFSVTQYVTLQIPCWFISSNCPDILSSIDFQFPPSSFSPCVLSWAQSDFSVFPWLLSSLLSEFIIIGLLCGRADLSIRHNRTPQRIFHFHFFLNQKNNEDTNNDYISLYNNATMTCNLKFFLSRKGPTEAKVPKAQENHNAILLCRGNFNPNTCYFFTTPCF